MHLDADLLTDAPVPDKIPRAVCVTHKASPLDTFEDGIDLIDVIEIFGKGYSLRGFRGEPCTKAISPSSQEVGSDSNSSRRDRPVVGMTAPSELKWSVAQLIDLIAESPEWQCLLSP